MKKTLSVLLALLLLVALIGCGSSKYVPGDKIKAVGETINLEKVCHLVMEVTSEGITLKTTIDAKDGMLSASLFGAEAEDGMVVISRDNATYLVIPESKTVFKSAGVETDTYFDSDEVDFSDYIGSDIKVEAGSEEYEGATYDFEKFDDGTTFYFEQKTGKLIYMVSGSAVVKYIEYSNDVDSEVFEIPSDYSVFEN